MNYRDYKGKALSFDKLSPELQQVAIRSFVRINMAFLSRQEDKPASLHKRINSGYWHKLKRSRALVLRIQNDLAYAPGSFAANLTEFTEDGEYLNFYLEQRI